MATEVMAAVTQWRRQAHNITIKYAAAGSKRQRWQRRRQQLQRRRRGNVDSSGGGEGDDNEERQWQAVTRAAAIAPAFIIFSCVGRPVSNDLF